MKTNRFYITQEEILITDPCYEKLTWCTQTIKGIPGEWEFRIDVKKNKDEGELLTIVAWNVEFKDEPRKRAKIINGCGVDSGQLGIFDKKRYPDTESTGEYDDKKSFYGKACAATLEEPMHGVIDDIGCVSTTSFGDGVYGGRYYTHKGRAFWIEMYI